MSKLDDAKKILADVGMPKAQANDRSAYVLLALAQIIEPLPWKKATKPEMRIVDMMDFMRTYYGKEYKPNTRETIRKDTLHQFVDAAVAERNTDDTNRSTNSPKYCYRLTSEMLKLIRTYGTTGWQARRNAFVAEKGMLTERYKQKRDLRRVPVVVNGEVFCFSAGNHNKLQKMIVEEFAPRFAGGAEVLYLGDAENKDVVKNRNVLKQLGIEITDHDKLPDVVLYLPEKNWLYFIEAVTSVGPVSVKRMEEIQAMSIRCKAGKIYVTAFPDRKTYARFTDELAWETEVWIADCPDHMIHLNGDRFMGPRNTAEDL